MTNSAFTKSHLLSVMIIAVQITLWICSSNPAFADCAVAKLLASDGAEGDYFGSSVAILGNTAVIGAPVDYDNGTYSGSAYIFRFDGSRWQQEAKLLASDGMSNDNFGRSVAISDDTAFIGAPYSDTIFGSVYIFDFNGSAWTEKAKLLASDGDWDDRFGNCVSISGDTAVIGAYFDDVTSLYVGSAYIFRFDGSSWTEEAKLLASDGYVNDRFGSSVAISGDTVVIGAMGDDDNGISTGSAYIFRFDGSSWQQEAKLIASDGAADDEFGKSVAIFGNTAVIGAHGDDDNGVSSGSAYIFDFNGIVWTEVAKLTASDGEPNDYFGNDVAISGNTAVVRSSNSAYTFLFDGSNWIQNAKLQASDGTKSSYMSHYVAISGDTAVIGAPYDDDNGEDSGSAYIFDLSSNPGDVDLDHDVDLFDYSLFAPYWLDHNCGPCNCNRADFNRDGCVDANDLKTIADNWLSGK